MDLDEYIKKLDACPKKIVKGLDGHGNQIDIPMLKNEYGLHANKMMVNAKYDRIDAFFTTNENYEKPTTFKDYNNIDRVFGFKGGKLVLHNFLPGNFSSKFFSADTKKIHSMYNLGLELWIDKPWINPEVAIPVLKDIASYAKRDSAEVCLRTYPWKLNHVYEKKSRADFQQLLEDNLVYSKK